MKRSKLIFIILAIIFALIIIAIGVDFSRRTKFPGPKKSEADNNDAATAFVTFVSYNAFS